MTPDAIQQGSGEGSKGESPLRLTREQSREVDRIAIEDFGVPGVVLMENAGRNAAEAILRFRPDLLRATSEPSDTERGSAPPHVVCVCGGGNNGGDGYVIARHLANRGVHACAVAIKPIASLSGDAAVMAAIAQRMGLVRDATGTTLTTAITEPAPQSTTEFIELLRQAHVVVDALLGTGFRGRLREDAAAVIRAMNGARDDDPGSDGSGESEQGQPSRRAIVAIDVPSGLDCDTGEPALLDHAKPEPAAPPDESGKAARPAVADRLAVVADQTLTFVAEKVGFAMDAARPYLGRVEVLDIGAPAAVLRRILEQRAT